ncbi:RidA family protein [Spirosoma pollinicola]|uniref:RidA family protein n=1 Tax=Spirosoma pollinicola TaxID=2057025 RepID=A0A2K8ZBU2_9BACT|nr:RidA family protein [Spirosoma pollinicola]
MKLFFNALIGILLTACSQAQPTDTPQVQHGYLYKVEPAIPGKEVYICGQRPFNAAGELVGPGNLGLQTQQVLENVKASLKTINMTMLNVSQVTYFVRGDSTSVPTGSAQALSSQATSYFAKLPDIVEIKSVSKNVRDDVLVEIEVVAVK